MVSGRFPVLNIWPIFTIISIPSIKAALIHNTEAMLHTCQSDLLQLECGHYRLNCSSLAFRYFQTYTALILKESLGVTGHSKNFSTLQTS